MNNRRLRFNLVDALILLLVAAVGFAAVYLFVLKDRGNGPTDETTTIEYVMEFQNLDDMYANSVPISADDTVLDAVSQVVVGKVKEDAVPVPYEKIGFDKEKMKDFAYTVEGRTNLHVTVTATAKVTDSAFTVGGITIRVGEQYSLVFPDFYGVGYCISLTDTGRKG